jgi:hypothetical protein
MFERAYSERVQTILRDVVSQQARLAEQELIADISAASVKLTAGQTLGAARDLLAIIERAAVAYRARERMSETAVLRVLMPSYAHGIMRSDLARQLPGDNSLGVTDQQLDEYLAVRHVSPIFWLDDPDMLGAEAGGSLQGWPTSMQMWMYAEGSFLFLDGGTLDLGIVRDSTLNASNDLEIFGETFEAAAFVGRQSLEIDVDICPSGEVSGTVDVTGVICMTGS